MAYHGRYWSPIEVLRDKSLSRLTKSEMLESWRQDKEAYMRASDEGMQGNDRSDLIQQIESALSSLRENSSG